MQKDIHFYLTYAVARQIGIAPQVADRIAWADQYTDELTESDIHGIQTQSAILGNWEDPQIQMSVLVPFHFVPGDDPAHLWKTTEDSTQAKALVDAALSSSDTFRLGISLHAYQDTFSHQSFSGWREELNSCYPWYSPVSTLPNVGHAEMRATPDIVSTVWTDPRTGDLIDNKERALRAARATYRTLERWHKPNQRQNRWIDVKRALIPILNLASYDQRKRQLATLGGNANIRGSAVANRLDQERSSFIAAAAAHLADALERFPWTPEQPRAGRRGIAAAPPAPFTPLAVRVAPNPFRESLRINVTGAALPPTITIRDRFGQTVMQFAGDRVVWTPGADVSAGLYQVKVTVDQREVTKAAFFER